MKFPILIGEILYKPTLGIVLQTIWYSDGTVEQREVKKYPVIRPRLPIDWF